MNTQTLAVAADRLASALEKESDLKVVLGKWITKILKPTIMLGQLTDLHKKAGHTTVECLLGVLTEADLRKLAKGLDKHNSDLNSRSGPQVLNHVLGLATGSATPIPAAHAGNALASAVGNAGAVDPSAIRSIGNRSERESTLRRHTVPQLKAYIKIEDLRPAGVRPKANKAELIQHVLQELDVSGVTGPRLLADSKYKIGAHGR